MRCFWLNRALATLIKGKWWKSNVVKWRAVLSIDVPIFWFMSPLEDSGGQRALWHFRGDKIAASHRRVESSQQLVCLRSARRNTMVWSCKWIHPNKLKLIRIYRVQHWRRKLLFQISGLERHIMNEVHLKVWQIVNIWSKNYNCFKADCLQGSLLIHPTLDLHLKQEYHVGISQQSLREPHGTSIVMTDNCVGWLCGFHWTFLSDASERYTRNDEPGTCSQSHSWKDAHPLGSDSAGFSTENWYLAFVLWLKDQFLSAVMILNMKAGLFDAHLEVIRAGLLGSNLSVAELLRALIHK